MNQPVISVPRVRKQELRKVRVADLEEAPWNPRVHSEKQKAAFDGTVDEIGFYGFPEVFVTDRGTLMLTDGHLRKERLISRYGPDFEIEVNVVDFTLEEARKATATKDAITGLATFDPQKLDLLLPQATFTSPAVADMFKALAKQSGAEFGQPPEIVEDEVPEAPAVPITQPGDLWICGRHHLLCGDSTKADDVARVLDGAVPFICVTDPPYGVEYDTGWRDETVNNTGKLAGIRAAATGVVTNDDQSDWTLAYKLFPGHVAYVWHAGRFAADLVVNLRDAGFEIRTQVIWRKPQFVIGRGHYHWQHEPCWYAVRNGGSSKWCGDRTQSTIWDIAGMAPFGRSSDTADSCVGHGTQKPVECMARPIRNHGGPDDDVYDPFLGSGTTLIACQALGRRCFAVEISPIYCDISVKRWENLSKEAAVRIPAPHAAPPA